MIKYDNEIREGQSITLGRSLEGENSLLKFLDIVWQIAVGHNIQMFLKGNLDMIFDFGKG